MNLNVIVKLHDRSREVAWVGCDWGRRIAGLGLPGVHVAEEADAVPFMFASDLMITDVSSISYEYCVLDRPIVIFDVPGAMDEYVDLDQAVWRQDHGALVARPDAICAAVEDGLANPAIRGDIRRWKAGELYHRPGSATDRAVAALYDLLELEAPPGVIRNHD